MSDDEARVYFACRVGKQRCVHQTREEAEEDAATHDGSAVVEEVTITLKEFEALGDFHGW